MSNSYYYNGNMYIPHNAADGYRGYILATMASGTIMGTLPLFSKPFNKQLVKEHSQNHLYKDSFESAIKKSGLEEKGVRLIPAQYGGVQSDMVHGLNACYRPSDKTIIINTDKISVAGFHEAGHAMNDLTGKMGKILSKLRKPGMAAAGILGTVALFSRSKPKEARRNIFDRIKDNCGKLAFICMLPIVFEEGLASFKGIKLAQKTGLSKPLINNMKKLYGKALLTYIGCAVATGLATGAANIIMNSCTRPKKADTFSIDEFYYSN